MQTIRISDATLREAPRASGMALSFKESLEIAKALDKLHPDGIELPPLTGTKADELLVKSIAAVVRCRLVLPVRLQEGGVEEAARALSGAALPCIQVAMPVSTVQMEYQCHKKPEAMAALMEGLIRAGREKGVEVEFSAEDATRAEKDFLVRILTTAVEAGATIITICDTAGVMLPEELAGLTAELRTRVKGLDAVLMGVQCSNGLHLAPACAMAAIGAGAELLKTTVPETGLLRVDAMVELLRARGVDLNMALALSDRELSRIEKQIDWILHARRDTASPYEGGSRREMDQTMRLGSDSTPQEIAEAVTRLGYDLSEEDKGKVYDAFRLIAAKKDVGEKELDAIVASAALQVSPAYTLVSYVINSGNIITALAHIKLERDGKALQGIGLGDGPIDASFLAIEQIVGHHYELDDFQIQAVTEGREAMGSALVRLRSGGRLYAGKGISTDIIGASIRAYINALNKIVYEEGRV